MFKISARIAGVALALLALLIPLPASAQDKVLKIGVLGVMHGPAASWGLVNKTSAETTAEMYNEKGGVEIGGEKYRIQIVSFDDRLDPRLALDGARHLIEQDGVRYIIGPNVDTTAGVIVPLLRTGGAVNIAYGFGRFLYTPPQRNSILGMVASFQAAPVIYRHLIETKGIRSVSFVARNEVDSLNQRDEGVQAARGAGLVVVSSSTEYAAGTTNFRPVIRRLLAARDNPVLVGAAGQLGGPALPSGGTLLDEVRRGEEEGCDGYVIACFGDPGLLAAREVARGPVVGIAEAAMHAASFIATGFSVVTTLKRTCIIAEHLAESYGMARFCRKVRGTDLAVLDLERPESDAYRIIVEECRQALAEDGSGAIVLGCAGMADLCHRIAQEIGAPVIDGVAVAVKQVEALVALGLQTSKRGDYAPPPPKPYIGLTERFAPVAR